MSRLERLWHREYVSTLNNNNNNNKRGTVNMVIFQSMREQESIFFLANLINTIDF